ncbi:preprotein translocase subunit YajC [Tsuneonella flava]|uniref:Preprotein translocase subunit YajC n=1 Tax=Tsuneonella flava TaxID=2055955 RepID=A0ABX7K6W2_9SPHN|nr:preprotein translocase subunit YajC [Tsuneonella flava]
MVTKGNLVKRSTFLIVGSAAAITVAGPAWAQGDNADVRRSGPVTIAPYIEASQVVTTELSPGSDTVTYTQLATGVDAQVTGRNTGGSASIRYERTFGYDDKVSDSSTLSGVIRGYGSIVPQAITIEGGALATRVRVRADGSTAFEGLGDQAAESKTYAAYVGPNIHTELGDAQVNANYRLGYTRVDAPEVTPLAPGAQSPDIFDDSWSQNANIHIGTRPGQPLPVGVGVGAGYTREDISTLDQRAEDFHARADVTVPLSSSLAAVGGIGYENVQVSSRDALRDANDVPILDGAGRYITDSNSPRIMAYDVSGLIWDVGVMWRPSPRTSFEAHVGRRYDSTTYYGSFAWAPNSRSALNVSAYDGITGFGGQLTNALAGLPTDFSANRNPITGDMTGCVASLQGGGCLTGALGSVRSATFRGRGIAATYSERVGRTSAGIGAGYDRRTFIAAPGTVLASANGVVDESYWASVYASGEIDRRSSFMVNAHVNWLKSGFNNRADATIYGASAAYRRYLIQGLSANAAIAVDRIDSDVVGETLSTAAARLGLRYDF